MAWSRGIVSSYTAMGREIESRRSGKNKERGKMKFKFIKFDRLGPLCEPWKATKILDGSFSTEVCVGSTRPAATVPPATSKTSTALKGSML
jgi:hypothetical protein